MPMEKPKKYKIVISKDALLDIKSTKKYILDTFKYREYAENFSKKIKKAIKELMLRVEMLTGTIIYAQAAKCREFLDILRRNGILKQIQKNANEGNSNSDNSSTDVLEQIEKLVALKESRIIIEEEIGQKKRFFWKTLRIHCTI